MAYCGERTVVKVEPGQYTAASLRCRSWRCKDCEPDRRKGLMAQAHGGSPNTFLTLTYRARADKTPDQAAKELSHAWRLVRLRIIRLHKLKRLPFLAVMEKTQQGWPHLHILLRSIFIEQKWISAQMRELIDSPVIYIQRIHQRSKIAAYVAKYCGKAAQKFDTAKRYWRSQDYDLRPKPEPKLAWVEGVDWWTSNRNLAAWCRSMASQGWQIERTGVHSAKARPPP